MVTIKDIAKKTGFSTATISRVLQKQKCVIPETREKIEKIISELGYRRNFIARSLRTRRSGFIGHIFPSMFPNPFWPIISTSIECEAKKNGYYVLNCTTQHDKQNELDYAKLLCERGAEGVIVTSQCDEESIRMFLNYDIKVIMLERPCKINGVDEIVFDNKIGAYQATKHLISLGHRKIAFVGQQLLNFVEIDRHTGFRDAMKDNNIEVNNDLIILNGYGLEKGYEAVQQLWNNKELPTAIFAAYDISAIGVVQALNDRGITVPGDVSVVGFDDTLASYTCPRLTTVSLPANEMGALAVKMLVEKINDKSIKRRRYKVLLTKLVVRDSTAVCRI